MITMQTATYKIAEQIENYGFFGVVDLKFRITNDYGKINASINAKFARWQPGILFGATYFLEHVMDMAGLDLEIINVEYNDVDTNNTIIAYLVFHALADRSEMPVKRKITFEKGLKSFIFPR
jgi:hypothetical protein